MKNKIFTLLLLIVFAELCLGHGGCIYSEHHRQELQSTNKDSVAFTSPTPAIHPGVVTTTIKAYSTTGQLIGTWTNVPKDRIEASGPDSIVFSDENGKRVMIKNATVVLDDSPY